MSRPRGVALLFTVLALCLLAACAPVVRGGSPRAATELGSTPIVIMPGQTVYVAATLQLSDVGLTTEMIGTALFRSEAANRSSARATGIGLSPTRVPAFFSVELESARYVERVSATRSDTTLEVIMSVTVPLDNSLGQHALRVRIESRRGGTEITIPIRVRQSVG